MKKRTLSVIVILLVIILFYLSSYPFGCGTKEEIIVIGIDGASWGVILPLIKGGYLPNLNKMMKEGSYGGLNSNETLDTSKVWTYISTGNSYIYTEDKSLWEILSEKGKVVGTSYWPSSNLTNGYMIPAYYEKDNIIYPSSLYDYRARLLLKNPLIELLRKSYYIKIFIPSDRLDKDILYDFYLLDYKSREFFYLRDKFNTEISAITFYGPDRLQHYLWMYVFPEEFQNVDQEKIKKYNHVIEEYYKKFDKFVGRVMSCNKDATIFILSGYGFDSNTPPKVVDEILVNNILEKADFLNFDYRGEIDFASTKAYSVEDEMEDVARIEIRDKDIKQKLKEALGSVHLVDTSQDVFKIVETERRIILERNVPIKLVDDKIKILGQIYPVKNFVYRRSISGRRTNNGIFLVYGKNIQKGKVIYTSTIYKIAPTILHIFGISEVTQDKVISDIFI